MMYWLYFCERPSNYMQFFYYFYLNILLLMIMIYHYNDNHHVLTALHVCVASDLVFLLG